MASLTIRGDKDMLRKARQYADERGTTLEVLLAEHLALLADRAGRRLTLREQIYADCTPSEAVADTRRAEAAAGKQKIR